MKTSKMLKKFSKALDALNLKEGYGVDLGNDVFLTGYCDGADKIYGFGKFGDDYYVKDSNSLDGYSIGDLDRDDLKYIMESVIYKLPEYDICDFEDI